LENWSEGLVIVAEEGGGNFFTGRVKKRNEKYVPVPFMAMMFDFVR
jgi:hypothetical protein